MTSNFYYLGKWDSNGNPDYLINNDELSPDYINRINITLPEKGDVSVNNPQYITNSKSRNLLIRSSDPKFDGTDVFVTFVTEGAGYKNVFGYYWYNLNDELDVPSVLENGAYRPIIYSEKDNIDKNGKYILHKTIVFPNASLLYKGGNLVSGNRVRLLYDPSNPDIKFPNNTGIGFFLIPNGWSDSLKNITLKSNIIYSDDEFNTHNSKTGLGYKQAILLSDVENTDDTEGVVVLGLEDIMQPGGDKDFNDLVIKISYNPGNCYDTKGALTLSPNDPIDVTTLAADSTGLYVNFLDKVMVSLNGVDTTNFVLKHIIRKNNSIKTALLKIVFDSVIFEHNTTVEYFTEDYLDIDGNYTAIILKHTIPKDKLNKFLFLFKSNKNNLIPSKLDPNIRNIVYLQNDYVFAEDIDLEYLSIYNDKDSSLLVLNGKPNTARMTCPLAMGDPHFTTITGKKYTLTTLNGNFRLLKNDYLTINTNIDFYEPNNNNPMYKKLTFMKNIYIKYGVNELVIDLFNKNKYGQIINNVHLASPIPAFFALTNNDDNSKTITINTKEMGEINFNFNFYLEQCDKINEFMVQSNGLHIYKSTGLLITPYNMERLEKINSV